MTIPPWRRKLKELAGAELAKFIPTWVTIEPPDVPQAFFIELEFYNWCLEVKKPAQRGEIHPSLLNEPKLIGMDVTVTGIPRKLLACYGLGAALMIHYLKEKCEWPLTLIYGGIATVTLSDDGVDITPLPCGFMFTSPIPPENYSPGEWLCQMIDDDPQAFTNSLQVWHGYYQTYLELTPTLRRFLAALPPNKIKLEWNPELYLPGVDPKNYGRNLTKLEAMGLIQVERRDNGTILGLAKCRQTNPIARICARILAPNINFY